MADSGSVAFDPGLAVAEIQAAQVEIAEAADAILFATETSLSRLAAYRAGDATGLVDVERALCAILGACAFQDLSGQRLSKIEGWLSGTTPTNGDSLARGPSTGGSGLDQDAADLLFAATPMVASLAGDRPRQIVD